MKTFTLILLLSCAGAWAQTTPPTNTTINLDPAVVERLRERMRAAMSNNPSATFPPLFPAAPAATNLPAAPPPRTILATDTPVLTNKPAASATNFVPPPLAPIVAPAAPPVAMPAAPPVAAPVVTHPRPVAAPVVVAPPPKAPEKVFEAGEIDFPDIDLDQVLEIYAQLVGRTVLRAQLPQVKIKLRSQTPLTQSEAVQALDSVLAMNGVTVIDVGDKFVKVVPINLAPAQAQEFSTNDDSKLPDTDQYVCQIVHLVNIKPTAIVQIISPFSAIPNSILAVDDSQILIIRDYAANVKRMLELIKQVDTIVPVDFDSEVIPIKYAQASDIASALSSLGGGTGVTVGKGATTGNGRTGATGGLGGTGGFGGGVGTGTLGGSTFGGQGTTSGLGGAGAGGAGSTFASRLSQIAQKAGGGAPGEIRILGNTKIIADQRTNSLLVYASKEDMKTIHKIVSELDIVLAQVLIEGIIMEVTLDHGYNFGLSYAQNNPSTPGNYFSGIGAVNNVGFLNFSNFSNAGSNSIASGLSYFGNFGGDFNATLTAIATDDRINVLSKPRIQTSHGVAANIQVGQTVPEVSGTYFGGINGQASSQYNQQFVGISLQVTPLINPDGLVVMDITANVQALGPNYTIDNNTVPSTTQRSAQSTVSVRDRDTIILGGMISTSKSDTHSGVPFLKDIPGLGFLFRSSTDSSSRTELIILLRPTVLPTPEAAALVAAHERAKLPGIKASERETAIDENRRLKEADAIKIPPPTRD